MSNDSLSARGYQWPQPSPRPIVIIGAGSIVKDAHLPAKVRKAILGGVDPQQAYLKYGKF